MSVSIVDDDNSARRDRVTYQEEPEHQGNNLIGLRDLLKLLRRRFVSIIAVLGLGVVLTFVVANELPRTYTAHSMIVLEPDRPNLLDDSPNSSDRVTLQTKIDTEADLITSRDFAGRVVDSLNLVAYPDFNPYLPRSGNNPAQKEQPGVSLLSSFGSMLSSLFGRETTDRAVPPIATQRDRAISSFLSRLSHSQNGESLAMTINLTADTAQMATTLANATTRIFIEWSRDLKRESTREAVAFLRQQAGELGARIAKIETEIAEYGRINGVSSDPRDDLLRAAIQHSNDQLSAARSDLTRAQSRLAQAKMIETGGTANTESGTNPLSSNFLTSLRNDEAVALRDRAQLARNYGANHPLIKEADAKIGSIQRLISVELGRIVAGFSNEVSVAQGRVEQLEKDLAASEKDLRQRSLAEIRLRELNRTLLTEQSLYDVVTARLGKLDPYAEVAESGSWVVSRAALPEEPSFPKVYILMIGGLIGSLVLALTAAIALESLDTRVREPRGASSSSGLPLLAVIPAMPRAFLNDGLWPAQLLLRHPRSATAEAFRALYGTCRRLNGGGRKQAVLIGSAGSMEGGTTAAIGLAVAAALDGVRTVLLDLDSGTGGTTTALQLRGAAKNLDEYFDGSCNIQGVVEAAPDLPLLVVLQASKERVLNSGEFERLMKTLKLNYDVVVVNAPPVLVAEDAVRVSELVDGVVVVAALGRTKEESLRLAAERLLLADAPLMGLVCNSFYPSLEAGPSHRQERAQPVRQRSLVSLLARPLLAWLVGRKGKAVVSRAPGVQLNAQRTPTL